jgi:excisionase family DNA binding protein
LKKFLDKKNNFSGVQKMAEKTLYTIKEAAKLLPVSEITLYRHTKNGDIPTTRIGRKVLIPASYINAAKEGLLNA